MQLFTGGLQIKNSLQYYCKLDCMFYNKLKLFKNRVGQTQVELYNILQKIDTIFWIYIDNKGYTKFQWAIFEINCLMYDSIKATSCD